MSRFVLLLLSLLSCLAPVEARAQTCSFGVSDINFGNVDTLAGGAVDSTATLNISCNSLVLPLFVRICPNIAAGSGGATSGVRHMRNASNAPLDFNLYQDSARSIPWGSVTDPSLGPPPSIDLTIPLIGSGSTSATIYARVPGGQQTTPTGGYSSIFSGADVPFYYVGYTLIAPSCSTVTQNPTNPSFTVLANVPANCNVTAQNVNFGTHGVLGTDIDATGEIDVTCTTDTAYTVGLDNGLTGTGPTARAMTLGASSVTYGLYRDAARSQPWGNSGGEIESGTGTGTTQALAVYGRVPAQSTPAPGTYTDTVVVTVTY